MKEVLDRIAAGELDELTEDSLEANLECLAEDVLNWNYGHTPEWAPSCPVEISPDRQAGTK